MTIDPGTRKHVFIDWQLIEPGYGVAWGGAPTSWQMPYGVQLAAHAPVIDPTPLIVPEHPWEDFINVYCTMLDDDGRFRLYYETHVHKTDGSTDDLKAMLAYAESDDGITWRKPMLGLLSFRGSTANNLVYGLDAARGRGAHGVTVFRDPAAPPDERYKLVHMGREDGVYRVFGAVSPDGLRWQALDAPLLDRYISDTQTIIRYDERRGVYVGIFRSWTHLAHAPGVHGRRAIAYAETRDFRHWPTPETIVVPEASDAPDVDIYTNSYTPWPGTDDAHLMFPAYYVRARDTLEVHLLTSRDARRWERPWRTPLIGSGEPLTGREGGVYAGCGLIATRSGAWSLPIGPKRWTHNQSHFAEGRVSPDAGLLQRAVWRPDGVTSLEARHHGACSTFAMRCGGSQLWLNAWTQFGGAIRCGFSDPDGTPIDGFTLEACEPVHGDQPAVPVRWNGSADLGALRDRPVRLQLQLQRARLHALQFLA